MVEFKSLYSRRQYLLEQIGKAADEIKQIDERLIFLGSPSLEEIPSKGGIVLVTPDREGRKWAQEVVSRRPDRVRSMTDHA
jgi:hypothetical protein